MPALPVRGGRRTRGVARNPAESRGSGRNYPLSGTPFAASTRRMPQKTWLRTRLIVDLESQLKELQVSVGSSAADRLEAVFEFRLPMAIQVPSEVSCHAVDHASGNGLALEFQIRETGSKLERPPAGSTQREGLPGRDRTEDAPCRIIRTTLVGEKPARIDVGSAEVEGTRSGLIDERVKDLGLQREWAFHPGGLEVDELRLSCAEGAGVDQVGGQVALGARAVFQTVLARDGGHAKAEMHPAARSRITGHEPRDPARNPAGIAGRVPYVLGLHCCEESYGPGHALVPYGSPDRHSDAATRSEGSNGRGLLHEGHVAAADQRLEGERRVEVADLEAADPGEPLPQQIRVGPLWLRSRELEIHGIQRAAERMDLSCHAELETTDLPTALDVFETVTRDVVVGIDLEADIDLAGDPETLLPHRLGEAILGDRRLASKTKAEPVVPVDASQALRIGFLRT